MLIGLPRDRCRDNLFSKVLNLCQDRIYGRLESRHWKKPKHLYGKVVKPLYRSLRELTLRLYPPSRNNSIRGRGLHKKLSEISDAYETIDNHQERNESLQEALRVAVRRSYDFSTREGTCSLESTISYYGFVPSEVCQDKYIRQIYKIGRYWGFCVETPQYARKYFTLFQRIELQFIPPYMPISSNIFFRSSPKPSVKCNVHAEIQLLIYYDLHPGSISIPPRVLGVSKGACYLCNLFILRHRRFYHTKTHGRLFDQWTLPDLAEYSEAQRNNYRRIINAMNREILNKTVKQGSLRRQHPANSWISLLTPPNASPVASDQGTILSQTSYPRPTPLGPTLSNSPLRPPAAFPAHLSENSPSQFPPPIIRSQDPSPKELQSHPKPSPQSHSATSPVLKPKSSSSTDLQSHHPRSSPGTARSSSPVSNPIPPPAPSPPLPSSSELSRSMTGKTQQAQSPLNPNPGQASPVPPTQHIITCTAPPPRALTSSSPPSSSSTLSITANRDLPRNIAITSNRPLHLFSSQLSTSIEIESPSSGQIAIAKRSHHDTPNPQNAVVVNVDALLPNEERSLYKPANSTSMLLCLDRQHRQGIQLELTWA